MWLDNDPFQTPLQKAGTESTRRNRFMASRAYMWSFVFAQVMFMGVALGGGAGFFIGALFFPTVPMLLTVGLGAFTAVMMIGLTLRIIARRKERQALAEKYAQQDEKRLDNEKRIADARASGAFERWEK